MAPLSTRMADFLTTDRGRTVEKRRKAGKEQIAERNEKGRKKGGSHDRHFFFRLFSFLPALFSYPLSASPGRRRGPPSRRGRSSRLRPGPPSGRSFPAAHLRPFALCLLPFVFFRPSRLPSSEFRHPACPASCLSPVTSHLFSPPVSSIILPGSCPGSTCDGSVRARGGLSGCGEARMNAMGPGVGERSRRWEKRNVKCVGVTPISSLVGVTPISSGDTHLLRKTEIGNRCRYSPLFVPVIRG